MKIKCFLITAIFGCLLCSSTYGQLYTPESYVPSEFDAVDTSFSESGELDKVRYTTQLGATVFFYYEGGEVKAVKEYNKLDQRHGIQVYWYENGEIDSYIEFVNGRWSKSIGVGWYKEGAIRSIVTCSEDTCYTKTFYLSGKIKSQSISLKYDMALKAKSEWCENGQLALEMKVHQKKNPYKEYFCDGALKISSYVNSYGVFIGTFREFFANGQLATIGKLKEHNTGSGIIYEGKWIYYNKKGEIILIEWYEDGELIKSDEPKK
jgi:antitoxin component YwqK of YwqJK toxin-antitoxin module